MYKTETLFIILKYVLYCNIYTYIVYIYIRDTIYDNNIKRNINIIISRLPINRNKNKDKKKH